MEPRVYIVNSKFKRLRGRAALRFVTFEHINNIVYLNPACVILNWHLHVFTYQVLK